jgi:hypothetical protein
MKNMKAIPLAGLQATERHAEAFKAVTEPVRLLTACC